MSFLSEICQRPMSQKRSLTFSYSGEIKEAALNKLHKSKATGNIGDHTATTYNSQDKLIAKQGNIMASPTSSQDKLVKLIK